MDVANSIPDWPTECQLVSRCQIPSRYKLQTSAILLHLTWFVFALQIYSSSVFDMSSRSSSVLQLQRIIILKSKCPVSEWKILSKRIQLDLRIFRGQNFKEFKRIVLKSQQAVSELEIFWKRKERYLAAKTKLKPTAALCELLLLPYDLSAFVALNETFKTSITNKHLAQQFVSWHQTLKHITSCVCEIPPFTILEEAFQ